MPRSAAGRYRTVVAAAGHLVDEPDRGVPRFPPEAEQGVTEEVRRVLERWSIASGDLAVTAGARGADIIIAELCLARGADVWLLLPLSDEEFVERSVRLPGTDWEQRFRVLRRRCPTRYQSQEFGAAVDADDAFSKNDRWCIEIASREAPSQCLHVLVVWDGAKGDGRAGTAHFVAEAKSIGAKIEVVDPTRFIGA